MKYIAANILLLFILTGPIKLCAQTQNNVIRGKDVLRIMVYDHPDLNRLVRVTENGTITFPLLGEVDISDMTVHEAERKIADLLSNGIIVDPQVNVFVEQFRSKQITVIGEVIKQGKYDLPMDDKVYVADIISNCQGLTQNAGKTLTIFRNKKGKEQKIVIDLSAFMKGDNAFRNIELFDGDRLHVPKVGHFYVYGEVKNPGFYTVESGLTVIKAISIAGGFTELASAEKIKVKRKEDIAIVNVEMDASHQQSGNFSESDMGIQADDIIYVPKSPYFYVYGEVNRPGYYKMEPGLTVIRAISIAGGVTRKSSTSSIEVIRRISNKENTINVTLNDPILGDDVIVVPESLF